MRMIHTQKVTAGNAIAAFTMIEITISLLILTVILLSSASAFSSSIRAAAQAERTTEAALFIETVTEDISALSYVEVLALNGNAIFDVTNEDDSNFLVALDVFPVEVGLIQLRMRLIDLRNDREMGRSTTLRSDW